MRGNSRTAAARRPNKKAAFLKALTETVNVTLACRHAGIPRRTFEGVERPVFYKGRQCGAWRYYSDALAMLILLRAHRPEKYRDRRASQPKDYISDEADSLAELLRVIDGRTRGLPRSQAKPVEPDTPAVPLRPG